MDTKRYCVIMAGGVGSRFWPMSRTSKPKQFLDILSTGRSFIRQTYERFLKVVPTENFIVVTNRQYKALVLEHIPELKPEQVLCEPIGRNTAPCIAYAAFHIRAIDPEATMIVSPADHLILNEDLFAHVITQGCEFAERNEALVTIGLKPSRPETGYGYIQVERNPDGEGITPVKSFTEKPTLEFAKAFVESGEFFWNSGIFIWQAQTILKALSNHLPETYSLFESAADAFATDREESVIDRIYPECRAISIDFGVMEKASNVWVRCSDLGWSDIGTWGSLYQYSHKDENGNVASDHTILFNTRNCILKLPEGKVAAIEGLDNYIVVDTGDVLMICPKEKEHNIKQFIDIVKYNEGDKFI